MASFAEVDPGPSGDGCYVVALGDCGEDDAVRVGGKAVGLGALVRLGLPVPDGFAVTTRAYHRFVAAGGIGARIEELVSGAAPDHDTRALSEEVTALFADRPVPADVLSAVTAAYDALGAGEDATVAVRSSATAEDTAGASFAGQQETYLWVRGHDELAANLVRCWASLFTTQAIAYRAHFGVPPEALGMGVVVQRMVPARCAGVLMTLEPVTGDRSTIYLEAAYGVGEGVVRGDVGTDRYWIGKSPLGIDRKEIGHKEHAHRFDGELAAGRLVAVPPGEQDAPALTDDEALALADLGRRIEDGFGTAMDVEWAVADETDPVAPGRPLLLQARPETVWNGRVSDEAVDPDDEWDPLHSRSAPGHHWTTDNLGEAAPGVLSPLGWSLWRVNAERAFRDCFHALGVLTEDERSYPSDPEERILAAFHGRIAVRVAIMAHCGNRMPGTTGEEAVRGIFGYAPDDLDYTHTYRRYPAVFWGLGRLTVEGPRRLRALGRETDLWWRAATRSVDDLDLDQAMALLAEGFERFRTTITLHTQCLMGIVQPMFTALEGLVERSGVGDVGVLSGTGGAEMAVVTDIWRASRDEIPLSEVVARHGFHGPREGEVSGSVWREDDSALRALVKEYAARPESESPHERERRRRERARAMTAELLAATPAWRRPAVRALLALAARRIPLRGVGKRSFVQSIDVCRAAARRIGRCLVEDGTLDAVEDVFLLCFDEIVDGPPSHARELVARRRRRCAQHEALRIPANWSGNPDATPVAQDDAEAHGDTVRGIGVSSGVVEGRVRVVTRPDFAEVLPDEVLVAPTTDPSWSSIMFVSSALVVDIGGALSHAAVVARELGLPCVVNTRTGTRALRTGDLVRVDGAAGTVHVLRKADDRLPEGPDNTETASTTRGTTT